MVHLATSTAVTMVSTCTSVILLALKGLRGEDLTRLFSRRSGSCFSDPAGNSYPINIDNSHTACYPNGAVVQGALYAPRSNVVLLKIQTSSCGEEVKSRKAWLLKFV